MVDFSIIIPQKNSLGSLRKLFFSIPVSDKIEIILVDNSPSPITKSDVGINRDYSLLWAAPERYAGGARNVGLENAHGKWLIFADADDYFDKGAFDVFEENVDSDADIVYFCASSIYSDTGEKATRGDAYTQIVKRFVNGVGDEKILRFAFGVPWCKMVRRDLVESKGIRFDEVVASNDYYFSLLTGYYAKKINAVDKNVYVVTVSKGSLTRRRDVSVIESRLRVALKSNAFLRQNGESKYQQSVMIFLKQSLSYGLPSLFHFVWIIVRNGQNPFVGWQNWVKTYRKNKKEEKKESSYITH